MALAEQLRYYIDSASSACLVRMVNAEFLYTYEYQGNQGLLVHTLTDKCYLTLTEACMATEVILRTVRAGKTESVKALGGCLGDKCSYSAAMRLLT